MSAFHSGKTPWAKIKHSILGNYLPLFVNKLGRFGEHIYMVDGFAGQGRYDDGQEGSAIITANIALHPRTESTRGALRCINVEKKADSFAKLGAATGQHVRLGLVQNIRGRFDEVLPAILREIDGKTALFFIDPFGAKEAGASILRLISERRGITEALVRFDDNRVKRLIRYNSSDLGGQHPQSVRIAASFLRVARDLTQEAGIAAANWSDPNAGKIIVEGYRKLVVDDLRLFDYGLSYPVVNPDTKGHRYYLCHFCKHVDGYVYMANFMAVVQRLVDDIKSTQKDVDFFGQEPGGQLEIMEFRKEDADKYQQTVIDQILQQLPAILKRAGLLGRTVQRRIIYAAIVDQFTWTIKLKESKKALLAAQATNLLVLHGSEDSSEVMVHMGIL